MSPIRKVTFLENFQFFTDKSLLSKEVVSYLAFLGALKVTQKNAIDMLKNWNGRDLDFVVFKPNADGLNTDNLTNGKVRSNINVGKCNEKYININLISEIEEIFHDEYIEIYEDFDSDSYNEYMQDYMEKHNLKDVVDNFMWVLFHAACRDFKEKNFNKAEYRPRLFKIKCATNYSQNSSDLELVINEASFNEILK